MKKLINIVVTPEQALNDLFLKDYLSHSLHVESDEIKVFRIVRRSIDARGKNIKINLGIEVFIGEIPSENIICFEYKNVVNGQVVIIVGAGPAGLFAALRFIELGIKPIILERGKDVSNRKRDIAAIHRNEGVNPDSNYGFGEGGAGTFSDGKLFTRSKKKGDISKILKVFHYHGAKPETLIDAHPHIGTNILPGVIKNIRESILNAGGEIHFNSRVSDFLISGDKIEGVKLVNGESFRAKAVILATGHSARDIYRLLHEKGIQILAKNFAVGVRVEHPQSLIDTIQYHSDSRGKYLPAATYSFAEQIKGRGVYSFCMCPGGSIVPAATADNELVVNGMSLSTRSGEFANSGIVTEVRIEDLDKYFRYGEFAGLKFQEELEQRCFQIAGKTQIAPAQRLLDFLNNKNSSALPKTSYHPGITTSDLHNWLPGFVKDNLQAGFRIIGNKSKGFLTNEAIIIGVESRTSSPIRIPRDNETFGHTQIKGLFPCGEGAGYSGGIISSAIDGERCAEKIAMNIFGVC